MLKYFKKYCHSDPEHSGEESPYVNTGVRIRRFFGLCPQNDNISSSIPLFIYTNSIIHQLSRAPACHAYGR